MSEVNKLRDKFAVCPSKTWADKLRDMIDVAELAVEQAGWPVRAVSIIVCPSIVDVPDLQLSSAIDTGTVPVRMAGKKKTGRPK